MHLYGCKRDKKNSWFSDLFIKKDGAFTAVERDAKF